MIRLGFRLVELKEVSLWQGSKLGVAEGRL